MIPDPSTINSVTMASTPRTREAAQLEVTPSGEGGTLSGGGTLSEEVGEDSSGREEEDRTLMSR